MSSWTVILAHASGEETEAEKLAAPIQAAGYQVWHTGKLFVGESMVEEAAKLLSLGCPVVVCGTLRAMGSRWTRMLAAAARSNGAKTFVVMMDPDAATETVSFDEAVAAYWLDPAGAMRSLVAALNKHCPVEGAETLANAGDAEKRYRELLLASCDLVDLANLPEGDRHVAARQLELRSLYVPLVLSKYTRARSLIKNRTVPFDLAQLSSVSASIELKHFKLRHGADSNDEQELLHQTDSEDVASIIDTTIGSFSPTLSMTGGRSIGEWLDNSPRLVILGDPGSGKSTLLRWIATAYLLKLQGDPSFGALPGTASLPDRPWSPILIRCRDLPKNQNLITLDDLLGYTLRQVEMGQRFAGPLREELRKKLESKEAILLVDGLDEIPDVGQRAAFSRQLEQIAAAISSPMVITSRIFGYREMSFQLGRGFRHLAVEEFSPKAKDEFARRWCELVEPPERKRAACKDLVRAIHSSPRIESLTANPMLLTTMALVKRKVGNLPERRVDLYREALHVLLNWRTEVDAPLDAQEALPQLQYLAYSMCLAGEQRIRRDAAVEILNEFRAKHPNVRPAANHTAEQFLRLAESRTGIVSETGHELATDGEVPVYEFRHLTFQEYLAARALVEGRYSDRIPGERLPHRLGQLALRARIEQGANKALDQNSWTEVIRLTIASCRDEDVEPALDMLLWLGQKKSSAPLREPLVLVAQCLADDPYVAEPKGIEIIAALVQKLLADDKDELTMHVARQLAGSTWARVLCAELVAHLATLDSYERAGLIKLAALAGREAVPFGPDLARWIEERRHALRHKNSQSALSAITELYAAVQLNRDIALKVAPCCLAALHRCPAITVAAILVTEEISKKESRCPKPTLEDLMTVATVWGKSQDTLLVENAAHLVIRWPSTQVLISALGFQDQHHSTRRDLLHSLGELRDEGSVPTLSRALKDLFRNNRATAAIGLGRTCAGRAELINLFQTGDRFERRLAWEGLVYSLDPPDRILLHDDCDDTKTIIQPECIIDVSRLRMASKRLRKSQRALRQRYEALIGKLPIRLDWRKEVVEP